ncbi:MAG: hypothetical protein CSA26_07515 [Desulfobacterales bacterium]|nr:MAG: hypothetical protein CSA26_07515 [Desulfobacterales bacterium]
MKIKAVQNRLFTNSSNKSWFFRNSSGKKWIDGYQIQFTSEQVNDSFKMRLYLLLFFWLLVQLNSILPATRC